MGLPAQTPTATSMKQFVLLFRESRELSATERKQAGEKVMAWAARQIAEHRQLDARILGDDSYFVPPHGETSAGQTESAGRIVVAVFLQAADLNEAVKIAKAHPGLDYGVSIEVRPWAQPTGGPPVR